MPLRDGTGPMGQGSGTGRGMRIMSGRGRMGGIKAGAGPTGYCTCPQCGIKVPHQRGNPCYSMNCPKCGVPMIRE